jgi:single-stranded-DNA-specific exonuclease
MTPEQPEKIWRVKEEPDKELVASLSAAINVSQFIAKLLILRGIDSYEKAKEFFCPSLAQWRDPFELPDMKKATDRVKAALEAREKILIFGDYDSDGVFSTAIVFDYLKRQGAEAMFYLPDRLSEGYGLSLSAVDYAAQNSCGLMIVLDNGTNSTEQIKYANSKNIDVIVIDHHLPESGTELPPSYAIVNPKRYEYSFEFDDFCAGGLALKFVDALSGRKTEEIFALYSGWAAVATAADIVSMSGENRVITFFGLKYLNQNAGTGLEALISLSSVYKPLTVRSIVAQLVPKINAAGRVAKADTSFELLFENDAEKAQNKARELLRMNTDRKTHTRNVVEQVFENAELVSKDSFGLVITGTAWHAGVVGMAASRCAENFCRPTVVLCEAGDMLFGSVRSHAGIDVIEIMNQCREYLDKFGGHKFAAGVSLRKENLENFKIAFNEACKLAFENQIPRKTILSDVLISLNELTPKALQVIRRFSPFGPDNMRPVFTAHGVRLKIRPTILNEKHLLLQLEQNGTYIEGTGFFMANRIKEIGQAEFLDVCFVISGDEGEPGKRFLRLEIRDFRISQMTKSVSTS